jgi:hypothetical protein
VSCNIQVQGSNTRNLSVQLSLSLTKMLCLSYYLLCFLFNKIGEQEGRTRSGVDKAGEVAQTMYVHVSISKNDKKFKKKNTSL